MTYVKNIFRMFGITLLFIMVGALGGYMYWYYVGCASGTCSITSKPLNSTMYGALLGGLFYHSFKKDK